MALDFSSDGLTYSGAGNLTADTNPKSWACWVWADVWDANGHEVLFWTDPAGSGFFVYCPQETGPVFRVAVGTSGTSMLWDTTSMPTTGQWVHVAATWDGSLTASTSVNVYYDGVSQSSSSTQTGTGTPNSSADWAVGFRNNSNNRFYNGKLSDMAVWNNHELTVDEIVALARGASPLLIWPNKLFDYLPLRDTTAASALQGIVPTQWATPAVFESPVVTLGPYYGGLINVGGFSARRRAIINKLVGDQSGGAHWDEIKAAIPASALVRTSDTRATLDLGAAATAGLDVTSDEVISLTALDSDMWKAN